MFINGDAFSTRNCVFQAIEAAEQGHETDLLTLLIQFEQHVRIG